MSAEDFAKLKGIEAGAQVNKLEGVKINGVALEIAGKIIDILIAEGKTNGSISVNNVDVAIKGLAALAYKANVSKTDFDAALIQAFDAKAESSVVTELSGKIDILNGSSTGSVKKAIDDAFNDFATKVSDDQVVNTYKELVDWAATHGGDAAKMAGQITKLEGLMAGIGGVDGPATVMAAIAKAVSEIDFTNYYTKAQVDEELNKKVNVESGKGLSKNDFTDELLAKLNGIEDKATANTYKYDAATETLTLTGFTPQA